MSDFNEISHVPLAKDHEVIGVASEKVNVLLDPLHGGTLVLCE